MLDENYNNNFFPLDFNPKQLPLFETDLKTEDYLSIGERLYCVIQDVEDYIQHNNLEQNKELDSILNQLEKIKEMYDESNI